MTIVTAEPRMVPPDEADYSDQRARVLAAQKDAFQAAMNGANLSTCLGFLVRVVADWAADGRRCAFYIANAAGTGLNHIVGMSDAYARDVDGFLISPDSLSCGLAVATGTPQITVDVMVEPRWAAWTWMAKSHGFRGCWSFPIETVSGQRVGSFAIYHAEPRDADQREIDLAHDIVQTAAIIISRHQENTRRLYSEERYRALFEAIDDAFCIVEFVNGPNGPLSDYIHVEANPGYERQTGIADVVGKTIRELAPTEAEAWIALYGQVLRTGEPLRFERYFETIGRHIEVSAARLEPADRRQVSVLFRDIETRRLRDEQLEQRMATLSQAEEQLRQSQKMDAIGQLTGGIAHDFNNLLMAISGALDIAEKRISQGRFTGLDKYISMAQGGTVRAAALTHRLLAFSREQTLAPKATNANGLVEGLVEMLQRTVGPEIQIETSEETDLWCALVDPSQLENAVLNLCINARDAMPQGGRIRIDTQNLTVNEHRATVFGMSAGDYVVLSVSDSGTGMSQDIIDKAFDPFFTTKAIGKGTGLGLSMIYGFVKQTGGQVRIESCVGEGSIVSIYLPRHDGAAGTEEVRANAEMAAGHGEVILIVDDEPSVRVLISDLLEELGYHTVQATDGPSGLRVLQSDARIDLVVTDVGLPGGMNGRQMVDVARINRPDLKSLFITGLAESALVDSKQLEPGMALLTKPFAMDVLASRVRELTVRQ